MKLACALPISTARSSTVRAAPIFPWPSSALARATSLVASECLTLPLRFATTAPLERLDPCRRLRSGNHLGRLCRSALDPCRRLRSGNHLGRLCRSALDPCRRLRSRNHLGRLCALGNRAVRHRLRRDARADCAPGGLEIPCHRLGPVALLLQGLPQFRRHFLRRLLDPVRFLARLAQLYGLRFNFALSRREFAPQRRLACAFLTARLTMLFRVRGQLPSRTGGLQREDGCSLLLLCGRLRALRGFRLLQLRRFVAGLQSRRLLFIFPLRSRNLKRKCLRPARAPLRSPDETAPRSRPVPFLRRRTPARQRLPFRALLPALEQSWRLPLA